jgi:IS30 family transposase
MDVWCTTRSAIGTLVDRSTRFTVLVHLPREGGWGKTAPVKNGTALSGYGASSMNKTLSAALRKVPEPKLKSLTWDRGKELSAHPELTSKTGVPVFFADPRSPWQRGTNENTNGLLRQFFPKGSDLSRWTARDLAAVARTLNTRPRKVLEWRTPAEAMERHLQSLQQQCVASTS